MKMTKLRRPCSECPFRADRRPYLSAARAAEIADALLRDKSFACHKTMDWGGREDINDELDADDASGGDTSQASFCAGAIGTMVNGRQHFNNVLIRFLAMTREKGDTWPETIQREHLYSSLEAWVAAHGRRKVETDTDTGTDTDKD